MKIEIYSKNLKTYNVHINILYIYNKTYDINMKYIIKIKLYINIKHIIKTSIFATFQLGFDKVRAK